MRPMLLTDITYKNHFFGNISVFFCNWGLYVVFCFILDQNLSIADPACVKITVIDQMENMIKDFLLLAILHFFFLCAITN